MLQNFILTAVQPPSKFLFGDRQAIHNSPIQFSIFSYSLSPSSGVMPAPSSSSVSAQLSTIFDFIDRMRDSGVAPSESTFSHLSECLFTQCSPPAVEAAIQCMRVKPMQYGLVCEPP
jgi:hypothetical protein